MTPKKAFEKLTHRQYDIEKGDTGIEINSEFTKEAKVIKALVDRATPKRVIIELVNGLNGGKCVEVSCNHCKKVFALLSTYDNMPKDKMRNFCPHCGQALEWEKGEPK